MKALGELVSFAAHSLGASPWEGYWPFNPSAIRTPDGRWLCSIRCANYHLPGSTTAPDVQPGPLRNRNLIAELDPRTLKPTRIVEMLDVDALERGGHRFTPTFGYEDLRLAWTTHDGLCAIGNSLMFSEVGTLEIVRLVLDDNYQIVHVDPLRGSAWSNVHQKNWQIFQGTDSLRLLYSVTEGGVHDRFGRIVPLHRPRFVENAPVPIKPDVIKPITQRPRAHVVGSMQVEIGPARHKTAAPRQAPFQLRGGTQLIALEGRWVGMAHGCAVGGGHKYYWHRLVEISESGDLVAVSEPYKLDPKIGIEFAAGLAHDPTDDRLVVSYGIEDDSAWLGVMDAHAALDLLQPIEAMQ